MLYHFHLMHRGPAPAPLAGLRSAALFSYLCTRSKASREQGIRGRHKIGAISPKVQDHNFALYCLSCGTACAVALDNATSWMSLPETYIPYNFPWGQQAANLYSQVYLAGPAARCGLTSLIRIWNRRKVIRAFINMQGSIRTSLICVARVTVVLCTDRWYELRTKT